MAIKIKNWKLALLALVCFCLLCSLGFWQLSRAQQKKILIKSFTERTLHTPFTASALNNERDWRFYRATLTGTFDNQHTLLLDNKTSQGRVGYEVYTPFHVQRTTLTLLVDRGFIPLGQSRQALPIISPINGTVTITGMLNLAPAYMALGDMQASKAISWPLLIEFVHLQKLGDLLHTAFFPYVLILDAKESGAFATDWQIVTMPPERHIGYAVQWFALALTLLILFVALNRR